jgi:hypothetical protein
LFQSLVLQVPLLLLQAVERSVAMHFARRWLHRRRRSQQAHQRMLLFSSVFCHLLLPLQPFSSSKWALPRELPTASGLDLAVVVELLAPGEAETVRLPWWW